MLSPPTTPTARGRNSGRLTVSAVYTRNRPLPEIWVSSGGPSPGAGADAFTAMPMSTGGPASTTRSARLRRRPNVSLSSLHSSRRKAPRRTGRTTASVAGAAPERSRSLVGPTSLRDIEALTGEPDEQVLERRPVQGQATDGNAVRHQRAGDLLRCDRPDPRGH